MANRIAFLVSTIIALNCFGHREKVDYHFTENVGQLSSEVRYHCKLHIGDLFLVNDGFVFDLFSSNELEQFYLTKHGGQNGKGSNHMFQFNKHCYKMSFVGGNQQPKFEVLEELGFKKNFIEMSGSKLSQASADSYRKVVYKEVYAGIDLKVYSSGEYLKYDFIVAPGASTGSIKIDYQGVDRVRMLPGGMLEIVLSNGMVREMRPYAYQIIDGQQVSVPCQFQVKENQVSFALPAGYDSSRELVIDPKLIFSGYSGATVDNWGFTATYDNDGNFYAGGVAFGTGFPASTGAYSETFAGGDMDVSIIKYDTSGSKRLYATYLGGSNGDEPHSLTVDNDYNLVIYGATGSNDFPTTQNAISGSFAGGENLTFDASELITQFTKGSDIFIAKLDSSGSKLLASTYLGGAKNDGLSVAGDLKYNYADHARGEVVVDAQNNIYFASSSNSNDFPITNGTTTSTAYGEFDAVVGKLSPDLTTIIWSTYLGGAKDDAAYSLMLTEDGKKLYVCGGTTSSDLPVSTGVIGSSYGGGSADGFVAGYDAASGVLSHLTYLGTMNYDQAYILDVDELGDVYVFGQTLGNYPVSDAVYFNKGGTQFIHSLTEDLTLTNFSTRFGSGDSSKVNIAPTAFMVDNCGNIYVSGWGGMVNNANGGTTYNMPVTPNALQASTNGSDFYFAVFKPKMVDIHYATFFGSSNGNEHVDGGTSRFDSRGTIYQAVCAGCNQASFPTTSGVYSETNGSDKCNLGAVKIGLDFTDVSADVNPPLDQLICDPPYVIIFDENKPAPENYWNFGDGNSAQNAGSPTHEYADTGSYEVMYVAIDSTACKKRDTAYFTVKVAQVLPIDAKLKIPPVQPCDTSITVQLISYVSSVDSLVWDLGDGTTMNSDTVDYTYTQPGDYEVIFTGYDLDCGRDSTISVTITVPEIKDFEEVIPNIFTPNGDSQNDVLKFVKSGDVGEFYLEIYNRWGRKVYETDNIFGHWNGTDGEKDLKEGVYFYHGMYRKQCNNEVHKFKGAVTLAR